MRTVIVEDERLSAKRLKTLIEKDHPQVQIKAILPSVQDAKRWLAENQAPELMFLDIELNDGTGFDVLRMFIDPPAVIFTTAFDKYAIRAFKFYSVDYLLKPIAPGDLQSALNKYQKMKDKHRGDRLAALSELMHQEHKKRFLIRIGEKFHKVPTEEIAYFCYLGGATSLVNKQGQQYPMDQSLDILEKIINPLEFFRVNRRYLLSISAIEEIHTYFNSRLILKLKPAGAEEVIVSRDRVADFKQWIDS